MSLIKESLTSGTCQDLIGFLQKNNNNSGCNKYWGEISNTIFINRSPTEIDIFIKFLIQLFDKKCIDNKDNQFVNESISFLAVNCDDSAQDCPLFTNHLGVFFAKLFDNNYISLNSLEYFYNKYYEDKDDQFSPNPKTKNKRFSKIILSILKCLNQSNSENVLKQISKQTFINKSNIDKDVFENYQSLYHYISK